MAKLPYHEMDLPRLFNQLTHVLVQWDKAEERRELRRGGRVNIYRMGHFLKAKQEAEEDATTRVQQGYTEREAFVRSVMDHFTPSPRINTLLRKVDSTVDVHRGHWTLSGVVYR